MPLDHIKNLGPDTLEDSASHQQLKIQSLALASEYGNEELPKGQGDCAEPQEFVCEAGVEEAERDDDEDRDRAGNRVEQVELCDIDLVDLLKRFLHSLSLVQDVIMAEHHQD